MKYKRYIITALVLLFMILYSITIAEEKWQNVTVKNGLPNRFIKDIKIDKKNVYIATANGVAIYHTGKKKITKKLQIKDGLRDNYISAIAVDKEYIWIGTDKGLSRYNKETGKIITYTKKDGLVDDAVSCVLVDGDFIWVGTKFWGISRYDKSINKWQTFSVINGLVDNSINCMSIESGFIWVGTKNGLSYFDKITGLWGGYDTTQGLQEGNIRSIEIQGQYLWLGTINGLIRFDKYEEVFKLYTTIQGLADDYIQKLTLDGLYLWIGTFSGVTRYNVLKDEWFTYTTKDGLIENSVSAMEVDGNYIWFGTDGNGISIFDKEIPQASISPLSYYTEPGEMRLIGTAYDKKNIQSYKIEYKNDTMKVFMSAGIKNLDNNNVIQGSLARWNVSKLFNINYDVRLTVVDRNGNKNIAINSFMVDTKPPQLTLNLLPEAVKIKTVFVKGTYIDNNITKILITINDKIKEKADLNRILKQYSKEIPLTKGLNQIVVKAYDIADLSSEINAKVVYDKEKPVITLNPYPVKAKEREVELSGNIVDSGIQRIVLNPGNEEIPFKEDKDEKVFNFSHKVNLEPGFNKYEITAYDFVGNKVTVNPVIEYVSSLPVISLDKSILRVSKPDYTVKGKWSDDSIDYISIDPFDRKAEINKKDRTFSTKVKLKEGENVITANIYDSEGNKHFDIVHVFYSTEKSILNLANLVDFTFQKNYALNGFYNEPNLSKLVLNPGNVNIPVDRDNQKFSVNLPLKEGANKFDIVMVDKYGAKSKQPVKMILDSVLPDISLTKTPTTVYADKVKIEGTFQDQYISRIFITPGDIECELNQKDNTFKADLILDEGVNDLKVIAMDKAGNKKEEDISITFVPGAGVATKPDDEKIDSAYVKQLKDEIARLKALLRQSRPVVYRETEYRLPNKTGVALVPYKRLKSKSFFEISKKYLGNYIYIDFINKYNNINSFKNSKYLLLPTRKFIKNYVKIPDKKIKKILDIVAISYKYSNRNYNEFRKRVGYYLYRKKIISKTEYNFLLKKGYLKGKDYILSVNKNISSSLPYNIRVNFNKSFMNVDVKQNRIYGKR